MKEVVVYESCDGIKFVHKKHCLKYETVLKECDKINELLPKPKLYLNEDEYICHNRKNLAKAKELYKKLLEEFVPQYMIWAEENGNVVKFRNETDKIIQKDGFQCFIKLSERFECIDKDGREFKFKELVSHRGGLERFKRIYVK